VSIAPSMSVSQIHESSLRPTTVRSPGIFRRFAAGLYDVLIVVAICMLATLLVMPFASKGNLQAFYANQSGVKLMYQVGLLALGFAFFGGFWTHGGQTIGMRAWRLRSICMDGTPLGWRRALIRYLTMLIPWLLVLLGTEFVINAGGQALTSIYPIAAISVFILAAIALIWPAFDRDKLAWHDHLSGTRLILVQSTHENEQS
jgi:uncharacterized RDD family membrane protein YckC